MKASKLELSFYQRPKELWRRWDVLPFLPIYGAVMYILTESTEFGLFSLGLCIVVQILVFLIGEWSVDLRCKFQLQKV